MPYTAAARQRAREEFEKKFPTPADRAAYYKTLGEAGKAGRQRARQAREQALADLRQLLEVITGESFGGTA
ncbi:MAG TPA: hypothetical protein VJT31_04625 [Rugosimonospora sp.]|nr:hypothetical protein [Rugosimonospora sp.]